MYRKYLKDQSQIFDKIQKTIANTVYIFDLNERAFVWMNYKGEELSGYTTQEIQRMGPQFYLNMMHPDDIPKINAAISKVVHLEDGKVVNLEYRLRDKKGRYHWINDCVSAFSRNDQGQVEAVIGVAIDADDRKAHEENLHKTIEKLNMSLSAAKMGTWEWDFRNNSLTWDERMYQIHGVQPGHDVNPLEEVWRRTDQQEMEAVNQKVQEAAANKQHFYVSYKVKYENGEVHHLKVYGKYLSAADPKEDRMYGVSWDSTEEVQTEQQIAEAKAKLISSTKMAALGEMSGGIAHEINNPLTVIQARAFQLSQMVESQKMDPEKIKQAAESISRTADKIARIIKSLRSFAREGTHDPFEIVSAKKIVEETLEFCRTRFYNHGVEIEVTDIDPDLEVECRVIQLEQVLLNLLNNSFDAVQHLPVKWIKISVQDLEDHIDISVIDSGTGIPDGIREQVMLPFFTTKEVGKGTGLGLSIAAGIVRSHKGDLKLVTEAPNTTFTMRLPKWQDEESEAQKGL